MADPITGPPDPEEEEEGGFGGFPTFRDTGVVSSFGELQSLIPDYATQSFNQILASPVFTGPNALSLAPGFQNELIQTLLQVEGNTGIPIASFANATGSSGALGSKSILNDLLDPDRNGGDNGGRQGQIILPDVIGTANAWLQYYETQVRNGLMERTQAAEDWDRKFSELNAMIDVEVSQASIDQNAAIGTNQASAAFDANKLRQQEEFGDRAGTFVRDFLPSFQPGLQGVSLPGVSVNGQVGGSLPVPQVNPDQIFGLGNLAGAGPTAPVPVPNPQLTPFDPSQLPNVPGFTPPPIPNIPGLLNQGFGINI